MAVLAWDQVGERTYQAGVDRGVLYLLDKAVVWNGLIGVDETFNRELKSYYQEGQKYLTHQLLGEFEGKLKAFTYPDEFEEMEGVYTKKGGLFIHDQKPKTFGLSYRTKLGNDLAGLDLGYRIHLLYNLQASPDTIAHSSVGDQATPMTFSWTLTSVPTIQGWGYRTTAHLSLKSTDLSPDTLAYLEGIIYGTATSAPRLPTLDELIVNVEKPPTIVDNGDGTWTASSSDNDVMFVDSPTNTSFQITGANAVYLDADTYQITTT